MPPARLDILSGGRGGKGGRRAGESICARAPDGPVFGRALSKCHAQQPLAHPAHSLVQLCNTRGKKTGPCHQQPVNMMVTVRRAAHWHWAKRASAEDGTPRALVHGCKHAHGRRSIRLYVPALPHTSIHTNAPHQHPHKCATPASTRMPHTSIHKCIQGVKGWQAFTHKGAQRQSPLLREAVQRGQLPRGHQAHPRALLSASFESCMWRRRNSRSPACLDLC
eukprot:362044-Chlamydomonas_euryale.AAC.8